MEGQIVFARRRFLQSTGLREVSISSFSIILSLIIFVRQKRKSDRHQYTTRNSELFRQAKDFAADTIISDMLDDPEKYGLSDCIEEEDLSSENEEEEVSDNSDDESQKAMWVDDIHLSTAGHKAFANRLWSISKGSGAELGVVKMENGLNL
jgi:hypothetical protein